MMLQKLSGLEEFTNLEELVLDNNMIGDATEFPKLKSLHTLTMNKNNLTNLDHLLDSLEKCFPSLTYLSLLGNIACPNQLSCLDKDEEDYKRYRNYVLYRLPKLKFLDSSPVKSSELAEAKRVGPFMKVIKLDENELEKANVTDKEGTDKSKYSPLPSSQRDTTDHLGSYGKSKYVYYGRHSEGNRFIRNNDL
ncbi:hypothetical protein KUTeg_003604 [Tegillarca granosa]|uniref:Leucine rich melanocyte differentiation associated n=1 Tax=Tegillarca granosa TaxID=220873 RepID=A0ABQ9FML4_TEGGR|nr:hypothetical protein KUTeg_003604 [Tegillarca granosa]